jgi:hypothetical protein
MTAHWPTGTLATSSKCAWENLDQTEYFPVKPHLTKKKKKREKNFETLNPQPVKSFCMTSYTEKIGGLQHCQMPVPNLPGRQR